MTKKNDNKSLFLYTALIFFAAVLLIVLSFLGQANMKKNQPLVDEDTSQNTSQGIKEKASVLSEENTALIQENNELKEKNQALTEENAQIKSANEALSRNESINEALLSASGYYNMGEKEKAIEILKQLNYDELSDNQKTIYNTINK